MLTIQFSGNKRFPKKKQSIVSGILLLSSEEQRIAETGSSETVSIRIDGSKVITDGFTGEITLGEGYGNEFLSRLESDLITIYPTNKNDIEQFIEELAEDYAQGRLNKTENKNTSYFKKPNKWIYVIVSVLFVSLLATGFYFFFQSTQTKNQINPKTSSVAVDNANEMNQSVQELSVNELEKKYPKRLSEVANSLAEEKQFDKLESFQEKYPTDEGAFNLAFYKKEWEKVIQVPSTNLSKEKQIMLAHAYIELGKLSEAEILNDSLKSDTLKAEMNTAYKRKAILLVQEGQLAKAEEIQAKVKDNELEELIETGKTCQEMIEFYKKEKDVENQELWVKRLENLGGELLTNEKNE